MRVKLKKTVTRVHTVAFTCDRCELTYPVGEKGDEFLNYEDIGGFHSRFDGQRKCLDLCEDCVVEILGPYMRIEDVETRKK